MGANALYIEKWIPNLSKVVEDLLGVVVRWNQTGAQDSATRPRYHLYCAELTFDTINSDPCSEVGVLFHFSVAVSDFIPELNRSDAY